MGGVGAFLKDAWLLARPYFAESEDRWAARGLFAAVIALALTSVGLTVLINFWRGAFYTALGEKDWNSFISLLLIYCRNKNGFTFGFSSLGFTYVAVYIFEYYLRQMLQIRWRRWMTDKYLNDWLADRAYYKISLAGSHELGTDNPDQRITEDIRDYCESSLTLTLGVISRVVSLFSFLSILWGLSAAIQFWGVAVPGSLVWIAVVYAVVGTICVHLTGRPLSALFFRQQRVEADFRYSLVRVRENVEGIALYRGEHEERTNLLHRFMAVYGNFRAIMNRTFLLNLVTGGYDQAALIFPFIIVAPGFFAGRFAQGVIFQTVDAFGQVQNALSWIIDRYGTLASYRAIVERLATFHRSIEGARAINANLVHTESADDALRVRDLELTLPNGTKLLEHADLTINHGHSMVITGRAGSGKSTLFRAISGIWPFARGAIQVPKNAFFLPQRPYIPLGTLRHVITYPIDGTHHDRAELAQLLRDVGLPNLVDRIDRDDNWPQSLSGGELQRIAIARALLAKPSWIFLDEATASLDPESEAEIYQVLRTHLPDTTLVAIAHGASVADFHDGQLVFERSGTTPGKTDRGGASMITFDSLSAATPDKPGLTAEYAALDHMLDAGDLTGALHAWDTMRRAFETWSALVHLKFSQDTTDVAAKAAREYADGLAPEAADLETSFKRRLLALPDQSGLARVAGAHAVRLWETDITAFDPAIKPDLEEESRLTARYTEILASAALSIGGTTVNLAGIAPFAEDPDRAVRHHAETLRWSFFAQHGTELDQIYADLVGLRHAMARKLGFATYTPLGYRRMRRVDYGPDDVARYREQVVTHVVPLVARLLEQRRVAFGWDKLRYWDEALVDPAGNPKPAGDHDFLVAQARTMFDGMDARLGGFYREMAAGGFLDLRNRPGKSGGGFCTSFPTVGMPFIFANFNGTHHDIGVFTHEMGHAFQNHRSRELPNVDYLWPTMEAAEIHSMSLEFLTWPFMNLLVGDAAADRFRRMHLIGALTFLPYGVCVDHFQHEVYAQPDATPEQRHAIWRRLEQHYMPWTDFGNLAYPAKGGRWQAKQHIYNSPFYYIDYTLAQCCALQFWSRARRDAKGALNAYVGLCDLGGSAPFQELVRDAGLISPFADGALAEVVREAEAFLATG